MPAAPTPLVAPSPGQVVNPGALVTPGGSQGNPGTQGIAGTAGTAGPPGATGLNAFNTTTAGFTVPAVGSSVVITLNDASWVVVGQLVYVDQAGGPGQAGALQVTAKSGNQVTLLNPTPAPAIPAASTSAAGLMNLLSGNTTDYVGGDNATHALAPVIWSARLRSFNAIGNPTFEVDQINCGNSVAISTGGVKTIDRWFVGLTGTLRFSAQQIATNVPLPGTNYYITGKVLRVTVTTTQASLGTGDYLDIWTNLEGIALRELYGDVHSLSLLCRSSLANLNFGISLTDAGPQSRALGKLCTLGTANTWTSIPLPNLPVFPTANFSVNPGAYGYALNIALAAGTGIRVAANDTWQTTSTLWAPAGIDNFAANASATFDLAFVQHEPGAVCTTPQDLDFLANYSRCVRYYQKSYNYATVPGTATATGNVRANPIANFYPNNIYVPFNPRMAKTPTLVAYSTTSGAANTVRDETAGADKTVTGTQSLGDAGFAGLAISSPNAAQWQCSFQWIADTGW